MNTLWPLSLSSSLSLHVLHSLAHTLTRTTVRGRGRSFGTTFIAQQPSSAGMTTASPARPTWKDTQITRQKSTTLDTSSCTTCSSRVLALTRKWTRACDLHKPQPRTALVPPILSWRAPLWQALVLALVLALVRRTRFVEFILCCTHRSMLHRCQDTDQRHLRHRDPPLGRPTVSRLPWLPQTTEWPLRAPCCVRCGV